jgi:hypothetical protein
MFLECVNFINNQSREFAAVYICREQEIDTHTHTHTHEIFVYKHVSGDYTEVKGR